MSAPLLPEGVPGSDADPSRLSILHSPLGSYTANTLLLTADNANSLQRRRYDCTTVATASVLSHQQTLHV